MHVLMCKPTYFDVLEKDKYGNMHMDPANKPNGKQAIEDWERLIRVYKMLGITVHLINPIPGLVDMTFTANCGYTFVGKDSRQYVLLSNFRPERRQEEQKYFEYYFRKTLGYSTITIPDTSYFEGAGDAIPFDDAILVGYGFRTSHNVMKHIQAMTEKAVIPLELKKPDEGDKILYHLDTTMIVMNSFNDRTIIAYKKAFTEASWSLLKNEVSRRAGHLFEATYEDAANLALNAVVVHKKDISLNETYAEGDETLMRHCAYLREALRSEERGFRGVVITSNTASDKLLHDVNVCGYYPITIPLSEFLKAGGGAFCLTKILCE